MVYEGSAVEFYCIIEKCILNAKLLAVISARP